MLTPKQEKFAQGVVSGLSQSDAYRAAYAAEKMAPATIQNKASALARKGEVRARVDELRRPIVEFAQVTLEGHLKDLLELRKKAAQEGQFSAAISAEIARGKASGIYTEQIQVTTPGLIIKRPA